METHTGVILLTLAHPLHTLLQAGLLLIEEHHAGVMLASELLLHEVVQLVGVEVAVHQKPIPALHIGRVNALYLGHISRRVGKIDSISADIHGALLHLGMQQRGMGCQHQQHGEQGCHPESVLHLACIEYSHLLSECLSLATSKFTTFTRNPQALGVSIPCNPPLSPSKGTGGRPLQGRAKGSAVTISPLLAARVYFGADDTARCIGHRSALHRASQHAASAHAAPCIRHRHFPAYATHPPARGEPADFHR